MNSQTPPSRDLRIFISYRQSDAGGWVGRLHDALVRETGYQVFRDIDDLPLGGEFADVLQERLADSDVVLALIGRSWLSASGRHGPRLADPNDSLRLELEAALRGELLVIPVLLEGADVPSAEALPASLVPLIERQALRASDHHWSASMRQLFDRLERHREDRVARAAADPDASRVPAATATATTNATTTAVRPGLPSGTVTLLFTDMAGSTRAWELDENAMANVVARHDELLRGAIGAAGGYVFKTIGDAFCATFANATAAVEAALAIQRAVAAESWPASAPVRLRCALHTGVCQERDNDYFGRPVNRVARLVAVAHGGQTVVSSTTRSLVDRLPEGASFVDLGEHRLKDLDRPEHVWQLNADELASTFPPLESLSNPALRTNIAVQTTTFLGRSKEMHDVRQLLATSRLVTIVGPGGVGKTRLALHTAIEQLDGSGDGVWSVELAPLRDPDHVAGAVTRTLGFRDDPTRDPMDHLVETCVDRDVLIILDNCEHVIDAVAKVADQLLRHCPHVALIATSREPLRVYGEQLYRLAPLGVPAATSHDLGTLVDTGAVQLFVERAQLQVPDFQLNADNADTVAKIVRRLDGVPLAIELAAARLDVMSVDVLEARLDRPFRLLTGGARNDEPRMQTMQALIDWSWDLLTGSERTVLARLSVIPASFTLEAAELVASVGDDAIASDEVVDHVTSLVQKSLIQRLGGGRFSLLETIRAYAVARLAEQGDDEVRHRRRAHRAFYAALARDAEPRLYGHGQRTWGARLDLEHDNMVSAIDRAIDDDDAAAGLELATTLFDYWGRTGLCAYAVHAFEGLLRAVGDDLDPQLRCRALADLASHQLRQGHFTDSNESCDEAIALARALDDRALLVRCLTSHAYTEVGDLDRALEYHDEALAVARALDDPNLIARALQARQFSLEARGDSEESRRCLVEERAVRASMGDAVREALALSNLADADLGRGDDVGAHRHLEEALRLLGDQDNPAVEAPARLNLGMVELSRGARVAAAAQFESALDIGRRCGSLSDVDYAILGLACTTTFADKAAELHGAVDALLDARGEQLQPLESNRRAADHERRRAALGDDTFELHYRQGATLTRTDAVALALTVRPASEPDLGSGG